MVSFFNKKHTHTHTHTHTQIRLADYMFDSERGETDPGEEHPGGPIKYPDRWSKQIYFDNDLEKLSIVRG